MSTPQITLFDLRSRPPCKAWSLNPWKTRLLLNYKGLDYKTDWVDYPDIKPLLKEHFPEDQDAFTIPTIKMPDGVWIMDSSKIAQILEKAYPTPCLHLDTPYLPRVEKIMSNFPTLRGVVFPTVPARILTERSVPYWMHTRSERVGMPLDQYEKQQGGAKAWQASESWIKEASAMYRENQDGPFLMGETVSYPDFIWAAFLIFVRKMGEDVFEEFLKASSDREVHLKLLDAVKPWSDRDDS